MSIQKTSRTRQRASERAPSADVGKRVLTLSPQLEVLHEFRGEGVPGEHDFFGMAARGDNELLVTNHCVQHGTNLCVQHGARYGDKMEVELSCGVSCGSGMTERDHAQRSFLKNERWCFSI